MEGWPGGLDTAADDYRTHQSIYSDVVDGQRMLLCETGQVG
jgi:hypothetical protein